MARSETVDKHTVETWIKSFQSQTNTLPNYTMQWCVSDGSFTTIFCDESILDKYQVELNKHITSEPLNQIEQEFYSYNPRLFAYDLYGYPELWYLILYANEMHSCIEFNVPVVKFYKSTVLPVLNSIRLIEENRMGINAQEITDIIVNKTPTNMDVNVSIVD